MLEASRLVAEAAGALSWDLVYQSRSGPPHVPWLEPDICAHLEALAGQGVRDVVIHPIGFLSDHMEVRYDLDTESREKAEELGLTLVRARTVGTAPAFVAMLRGADPGTNGGAARTSSARHPRPEPRHLSARLLPGRTPVDQEFCHCEGIRAVATVSGNLTEPIKAPDKRSLDMREIASRGSSPMTQRFPVPCSLSLLPVSASP